MSLHSACPRPAATYPFVHLVHLCIIIHALEVDIDFNYLFPGGSSGGEDISQILDALLSVFGDSAFSELALFRKWDLNNRHQDPRSFSLDIGILPDRNRR